MASVIKSWNWPKTLGTSKWASGLVALIYSHRVLSATALACLVVRTILKMGASSTCQTPSNKDRLLTEKCLSDKTQVILCVIVSI